MFNLVKFEILKKKKIFSTLGILLVLSQLFSIYKFSTGDINSPLAIIIMFSFVSYVIFIFSSISSFSKDINSKDRSFSFMIPKSGFEIITAKFLATFIAGLGLVLVTGLVSLANIYYSDPGSVTELFSNYGSNTSYFIIQSLFSMISVGSFLALVLLSIIITKTFLERIKFKKLIIIVIMMVLSKLFNLLFWDNLGNVTSPTLGSISALFITIVMLWISGWLVDNKTDF